MPEQNRSVCEGPRLFLSLLLRGGTSESEKQVLGHLGRGVWMHMSRVTSSGGIYHKSRISMRAGSKLREIQTSSSLPLRSCFSGPAFGTSPGRRGWAAPSTPGTIFPPAVGCGQHPIPGQSIPELPFSSDISLSFRFPGGLQPLQP